MIDFEPTVLVTCPSIDNKPFIRSTNIIALQEAGLRFKLVDSGMSRMERRAVWEQTDGTFRTGGLDINPVRFGQMRHPHSDIPDTARDDMEATLVMWDLNDGRPSINTCLGLQWLLYGLGKITNWPVRLIQHLPEITPERHGSEIPKYDNLFSSGALTEVQLQPGTQMHGLYLRPGMPADQEIIIPIPCEHHQLVDQKSITGLNSLRINALSPTKLIEGFEITPTLNPYALATQGHIEAAPEKVRQIYFQGFAAFLKNRKHNFFLNK